MPNTTIQISKETKKQLDNLKEYRRETYNDIIQRLIGEKNPNPKPPTTKQTISTQQEISKPIPAEKKIIPEEIEQEE
jgi:predicted CopG family antitoxin